MRKIIRARWLIAAIWLVATVLLVVFQPDVNAILRHRGLQGLNDNNPSVQAEALLSKMEAANGTDNLLVFYDKNGISDAEMTQIEAGVKAISDSKAELGIDKIIDPFSEPEARSSLVSEDGTTLMVSFKLDKGTREVADIKRSFDDKLSGVQAEHYLTGEDFINDDYLNATLAGVEKSAVLTVLFILIVLIIMFRSVLTPVVSLLAVGFSYFCSMGIAAQLIAKAGFPVTTLTQVLLILILFGIGTDYNILLFNRFREELSRGSSVDNAILGTYKTAGKTIAFSVLTVLIAFLSLIFSESPIYKSGIVIVIGAAVLLLEILTLTPLAMKVCGGRLFWPSRNANGHRESKLWDRVSTAAAKHPVLSVVVIVLIIVPTIFFYQQKLSFDTIGQLGDSAPSTKAFNLVAEHFGRGEAMPVTVVIENSGALDNNESLSVVDDLTEKLKKTQGVSQVSSATQPEGKQIDDFYIGNNMTSVTQGLSQTQDGVDQINDGLKQAQDQLGSADFSKVGDMVSGMADLKSGLSSLTDGLKQIQTGIKNGSDASSISGGIAAIRGNLAKMSGGLRQLSDNYQKMQSGYATMGTNYQGMAQALLGVKGAVAQMQTMVTALGSSYANAQSDPSYLGIRQTLDALSDSLGSVTPAGIDALNKNYDDLTSGFKTANAGLATMGSGLTRMSAGLKKLESGLGQSASGIGTVAANMDQITDGLGQMQSGLQTLNAGLGQFGQFGAKLAQVNDGLSQISGGLTAANGYLAQLDTNKTFFIPKEALANADFQKSLDAFMSGDRKITKLIVVLDDDPYSQAAQDTVSRIRATVSSSLSGTALSAAQVGVLGVSATTLDMNGELARDLNRMILIVIVGVFLVLLLVIRSLWAPVCITVSLLGSFYASMFVMNTVFIHWMGNEGISSFLPFFSFLVIVALGVDYSIFLMMRFKEYPQLPPREAIVMACRNTGGVVMSAAIILGGTFATLMPTGIVLLSELATAVLVGLFVLCFILLPVFLPAMIARPGAARRILSRNKEGLPAGR